MTEPTNLPLAVDAKLLAFVRERGGLFAPSDLSRELDRRLASVVESVHRLTQAGHLVRVVAGPCKWTYRAA